MDHMQKYHERHKRSRQKKQARRRQIEAAFAGPRTPSVWVFRCLTGGIVLGVAALLAWIVATQM